ncbi:hypothetical protein AK812_SmicGene4953 [Symbiodinium microadriaticum]|uniref:Uncharacterized protein n=1 Tax=Symbiodinium microadriaticum TaxID=2951 RepID=A0A1Q9EV26_SYMMI|nr:hypothetical protein AK812_SmicGene4953 [Symbiodinium microadriaticum]
MPRRLLLCPGATVAPVADPPAEPQPVLAETPAPTETSTGWAALATPDSPTPTPRTDEVEEAEMQLPAPALPEAPPLLSSVPTPVRSQKRPLLAPAPSNSASVEVIERAETADACYKVNFTKEAQKKRKTFRCGFLRVKAGKAYLYDDEGRHVMLGRSTRIEGELQPGAQISPTWETLVEVHCTAASVILFVQPVLTDLVAERIKRPAINGDEKTSCSTALRSELWTSSGQSNMVEHAVSCDDLDSGRAFAGAAPAPKGQAM